MRSIWYSLISFYSCISTPKHSPGIITRQFSNNQHDDAVILSLYVNAAIQVHLIIWDTFCVNAAIKVHLIIRDTFSVSYIFRIRWHTRWTSSIRKKQNNLNATSFWQVNSCSNVSYAFLLSILSIQFSYASVTVIKARVCPRILFWYVVFGSLPRTTICVKLSTQGVLGCLRLCYKLSVWCFLPWINHLPTM